MRRPDVPCRAGLVDAGAGGRLAGAALVVHRHAGPPLEHPGDRRTRACRWCVAGPTGSCPHPNYVAVVVEGFALPLVHAAWITALVFTVANAALLRVRLRVENAAPCSTASSGGAPDARPAWSPAAARSGWPPRCTPPAPGSTSWSASRARGVIDKACGEGLMPGGGRRPADLGVRPGRARRSTASATSTGGTTAEARVPARPGPRRAPHRRCTRRCCERGRRRPASPVEQRPCARSQRPRRPRRWSTASRRGYLVAADGLHSPVRRLLGLDAPAGAAAAVRAALPRRDRAVDVVRRGALVARSARPT